MTEAATVTIHIEATEAIAQCDQLTAAANRAREAVDAFYGTLERLRRPVIETMTIPIYSSGSPSGIAKCVARTLQDVTMHPKVIDAIGAGVSVQKLEIVVSPEGVPAAESPDRPTIHVETAAERMVAQKIEIDVDQNRGPSQVASLTAEELAQKSAKPTGGE